MPLSACHRSAAQFMTPTARWKHTGVVFGVQEERTEAEVQQLGQKASSSIPVRFNFPLQCRGMKVGLQSPTFMPLIA